MYCIASAHHPLMIFRALSCLARPKAHRLAKVFGRRKAFSLFSAALDWLIWAMRSLERAATLHLRYSFFSQQLQLRGLPGVFWTQGIARLPAAAFNYLLRIARRYSVCCAWLLLVSWDWPGWVSLLAVRRFDIRSSNYGNVRSIVSSDGFVKKTKKAKR